MLGNHCPESPGSEMVPQKVGNLSTQFAALLLEEGVKGQQMKGFVCSKLRFD